MPPGGVTAGEGQQGPMTATVGLLYVRVVINCQQHQRLAVRLRAEEKILASPRLEGCRRKLCVVSYQ